MDIVERLREDKLDALAAVESENAFYQMEIERLRAICKELLQHAEYLLSETEKAKEKDVTLLQTRILRARAALKEGE